MPRLPRAAAQLALEVEALYPSASFDFVTDSLDGYGVYRQVEFYVRRPEIEHLTSLLQAAKGERIIDVYNDGDATVVTFSPHSPAADDSSPFSLRLASEVLDEHVVDESDTGDSIDIDVLVSISERESALRGLKVAELREEFPQYADLKKADIIQAVVSDEFDLDG